MNRSILFLLLVSFSFPTLAQKSKKSAGKKVATNPTLFSVQDQTVTADEFIYLYNKNHPTVGDHTPEKIQEYFDLYINFKLKVTEAVSRGMDTTAAFKKEYNSYKDELRKPYLPDNKIIDSLVKLTYERLKFELNASHILIGVKEDAAPADTLAAYKKCMEIKEKSKKGEDFGLLAQQFSEDPSAKQNQGSLGYFTALQMVYPFESTAYQAKVGEVVGPVRTQFGYHLIKVFDKRPSSGEVEVSHIMLRASAAKDDAAVRDQIFKIQEQALAGVAWDELCKQFSEDQGSKDAGGLIRPFGIRGMASVPEFEETAFALKNVGDISDPFKTAYGWHIIRLEKKIPLPSLEALEPSLKTRVSRDQRVQVSKQQLLGKLKKHYRFTENQKTKSATLQILKDEGDLTAIGKDMLFDLNEVHYTVQDFAAYVKKATTTTAKTSGDKLYDAYVQDCIMQVEENRILSEHPEYAMLLREYYEGILLFEIMEKEVWNNASLDSTGLATFFASHADQYQAGERAEMNLYSSKKVEFSSVLTSLLQQGDSLRIAEYISKNGIRVERGLFQKGDRPIFASLNWAAGTQTAENSGMYYLAEILNILPAGQMTLEEAKVSVLTDYQEYLEQGWIDSLKAKYPIKINEKGKKYVFEQLQQ